MAALLLHLKSFYCFKLGRDLDKKNYFLKEKKAMIMQKHENVHIKVPA